MSGDPGWDAARALAALAVSPLPARTIPLRDAVGAVPPEDLVAARPLPHYDSSAMDGFAVAGVPPWRLTTGAGALRPGEAREVVTGSALPAGTQGVLALERADVRDGFVAGLQPAPGQHVRRAGEEAPAGTVLVPAGDRLSPAQTAVLAIAGFDELVARARPRVAVVLTGDEVQTTGSPEAGRVRDAFDPLLPLAIERLGGRPLPPARVGDDPARLRRAIADVGGDLVITVGGTGRSRADRLREALAGAETVFDGVAMRPGHPALLVRLADGRPLLGLPGNPLAAVAALLTFLPPALDGLQGVRTPEPPLRPAAEPLEGHPTSTMLVPCRQGPGGLEASGAARPNMLRGLAAADALAVVPPGGAGAGEAVRVLPLPW